MQSKGKKKLFLSHASADKILADRLADLLTNGCAVDPNDVLCTSLEGKGIPAGTSDFIAFLRKQICEPSLVILLLSENYFDSLFCVCELGAVWGMTLPCFPLVVPPTNKSELKATLAVMQAGDIDDSAYLDELRDAVIKSVGCKTPTATWSVKRDAFLAGLNDVIESLPSPQKVSLGKLQAAEGKYEAALKEIANKEKEMQALRAVNTDLEKCKDRDEVNDVVKKHSTTDEVFQELCEAAKRRLDELMAATKSAIFFSVRDENYIPRDREMWEEVHDAETVEEVYRDDNLCFPSEDHPRVRDAMEALEELGEFLCELTDKKFKRRFEAKNKFPLSLTNKDFWAKYLVKVW